jgi:iron complex outermembrane receptor protein
MKAPYFAASSGLALAAFLGIGGRAAAQTPPDARQVSGGTAAPEVSEIVVTGSFIAGTPEDAAMPVDVTTAQELQRQGSPTIVQLVKTLPAAAGSIGESNRFLGNNAGTATVNLRGFGSARTLVLMNGRRMATSPAGVATAGAVDINTIPVAAVGRIEVLKGGAAATYGSDAVGGVVNFITRTDLDGLELNGEYSAVRGSAGDYNVSVAYGRKFDDGNILLTAGYRRRSELRTTDRDWAIQPNIINPFGGWSGASNPGAYQTFAVGGASGLVQQPNGAFTLPAGATTVPLTTFNDVGCTELGGFRNAAGGCSFQFSRFDNLVNDEYHYQLYGEANYDFTDDLSFHAEAFWTRHDVPRERVSPSQSTAQFPTPISAGGTSPFPAFGGQSMSRFYIPFANPGLQAYFASQCAGVVSATCANLPNGVVTSQTAWRPQGYGGNPLFPDQGGADVQSRANDSFRISAGLKGRTFWDINWDAAVTYMDSRSTNATPDIVTERLQLALTGLGGPGCNPATGTPGQGACLWFNPFSNGIPRQAVNAAANPLFSQAAVTPNTNTNALFDWMHQYIVERNTSRILVGDLVLNGGSPINLPGGEVKWALGGQLRYDELEGRAENDLANAAAASNGVGPFNFYPAIQSTSVDRTVSAVFGELRLPIFESLDASFAIRHEIYGGNIGSTTNPKFDVKWQALDWLAFRASIGTTFRAPPQGAVTAGANGRILAQVADPTTGVSLYRPIDVFANPDLQPEKAKTYDLGVIVSRWGLRATVDYWRFKFEDELTTETGASIVSTLFPSATPTTWQCANANLTSRVAFAVGNAVNPLDGGNCHPSNVLGVRTNWVNGPAVDTSGIDFQASYDLPEFGSSNLVVGVEGSYLIEYKRDALRTLEGVQIQPALDRAGQLELLSSFYSYPRLKANGYVNWSSGPHNLRVTARYIARMKDRNHDRAPTVPGLQPAPVGAYVQLDVVYRVELPWETTLTLQVQNLFDEDPSFAFSQYNYDYTLGNPLGRVYGVAFRKRF